MNILLAIVPRHLPAFVRRAILSQLLAATAKGFACPHPGHDRQSYDECLYAYAQFTTDQAKRALQSGQDIAACKVQLYQNAYPLGARLRKWFGLNSLEEVMALAQILYRAIGIDLQGDTQGNVTVKNCYFSQFYPAPVCDLISALDEGLFAGLSGGNGLVFSQRLTEGKSCCRARLLLRSE